MVELDADEETELVYLRVDGKYVPRVLFLDRYGRVITEASNGNRSNKKYYYENAYQIVETINRLTGKRAPRVNKQDL